MKTKKKFAILLLTSLAIASLPLSADANLYGCYSYGYPSRTFSVNYSNSNAAWSAHFDVARSNWNTSGAGVSISKNNTATSSMSAAPYTSQTWFGLYTPQTQQRESGNRIHNQIKFRSNTEKGTSK